MGIIGSTLQPFKATAFQAGKDFFDVTSEDLAGKWSVFFFYPADFTFVCPTELEDMGEKYEMLQSMGVEVYAVSTDTHFSHKAWHDTSDKIGKLTFPFLGDQNHVLSNNFGVLREGVGLADRATFVVDPDGVIQIMEITCEGVGRNANELTRKIKAAQSGLCPVCLLESDDSKMHNTGTRPLEQRMGVYVYYCAHHSPSDFRQILADEEAINNSPYWEQ
jgi:peroxiredoxin (alkyl hydroperoxide reductase subunit C)